MVLPGELQMTVDTLRGIVEAERAKPESSGAETIPLNRVRKELDILKSLSATEFLVSLWVLRFLIS